MARTYHHVLFIDATYKTNKYKFPPLHACGMAATNLSFSIGFVFMENETEDDYNWAVEQLKSIWHPERLPKLFLSDREKALAIALSNHFPDSFHHLCTWHIRTNIVTNCKAEFKKDSKVSWAQFKEKWESLVYTSTEASWQEELEKLKALLEGHPNTVHYLEKNILKDKEQFMGPWTSHFANFGQTSSSRAESGHAYIKRYIQSSQQDLFQVCEQLMQGLDTQVANATQRLATDETMMVCNLPPIFSDINRKVSCYVVSRLMKEYKKMLKERKEAPGAQKRLCTGTYAKRMGDPCGQILGELLDSKKKLSLGHLHLQWHLQYNADMVSFSLWPWNRSWLG